MKFDLGSFGRFLGHHAADLGALKFALDTLIDVIPVQPAEKAKVKDALSKIATSVEKVAVTAGEIAAVVGKEATATPKPAPKPAAKKAAPKPATPPSTSGGAQQQG